MAQQMLLAPLMVLVCCLCCVEAMYLGGIDPNHAVNLTIYHVNQQNYSADDIKNMNTASAAGDLFFDLRSRCSPIECRDVPTSHDCYNPEVNSTVPLGITKLILEVDSRFGPYSRCNIVNGIYSCQCLSTCVPQVGLQNVSDHFCARVPKPNDYNWMWWKYNLGCKTKGVWYSTLDIGECTSDTTPCTWRVVEVVKRIDKNCSDALINQKVEEFGGDCFSSCPQPTNTSSDCYIECFYNTLLGPGSGNKSVDPGSGMNMTEVIKLFDVPFQSEDPSKGGCPALPNSPIKFNDWETSDTLMHGENNAQHESNHHHHVHKDI